MVSVPQLRGAGVVECWCGLTFCLRGLGFWVPQTVQGLWRRFRVQGLGSRLKGFLNVFCCGVSV